MADSAKETVIIVHGTSVDYDPMKRGWYEPVDGRPGGEPFPAKLDAALQARGSQARCWAHCSDGNRIFEWWPGANNWVARTSAGAKLADYVASLQKQGWRCHILAHSHGGNVVVEALPQIPQILAKAESHKLLGTITTLGTPFIDIRSPISQRRTQARSVRTHARMFATFTGISVLSLLIVVLPLMLQELQEGLTSVLEGSELWTFIGFFGLFVASLWYAVRPQTSGSATLEDVWPAWLPAWLRFPLLGDPDAGRAAEPGAGIQLQFLAIGSRMDEPWQLLHSMRSVDNPLAVGTGLRKYLFSFLQSRMSQGAKIDATLGAKLFKDASFKIKILCALLWTFALCYVVFWVGLLFWMGLEEEGPWRLMFLMLSIYSALLFIFVLPLGGKYGRESQYDNTAMYAPVRWYNRLFGALLSVPTQVVTYFVRRESWSVLVAIAMGLEGYRFDLPEIGQRPHYGSEHLVLYEDMPIGAERRALNKRSDWLRSHFGDVSETFARLAITTADIKSLLHIIAKDQTLVHAAYYTDDECIARIADWIAGKQ
jgi:uncharacterized membrane protein